MQIDVFIPFDCIPQILTTAVSVPRPLSRGTTVRVFNSGGNTIYVRFGDVSVVATSDDAGIPPNGVEFFSVAPSTFQAMGTNMAPTHIAALSPTGGSSVNVCTGEGA